MKDNDGLNEGIDRLTRLMHTGKLSMQAIEIIGASLDKLSHDCDGRIYAKLNKGERVLFEDLMMSYAEKNAYNNLLITLKKNIAASKTAGEYYKKIIEGESNGSTRPVPGHYKGI